jgi:CubicO group peptidase (beta-lactamase class C family)
MNAQSIPASPAGFDDAVADVIREFQVPGFAVSAVQHGRVVLQAGYGLRDVAHRLPVTADTLFPIASATKPFTSLMAAMMVEEGHLAWDVPLREFLPRFRLMDPVASEHATLRDLLCHRTGLPRHDHLWVCHARTMDRSELVGRLRYLPPSWAFRTHWEYNNLMFITAGHAVEHATGRGYEESVQDRILKPLEMHSSLFSVEQARRAPDHSCPYKLIGGAPKEVPHRDISVVAPAGGIISNVKDMAHWLLLQLGNGQFEGRRLASEASIREMWSPQMVIPDGSSEAVLRRFPEVGYSSYGLGWFNEPYRGLTTIHHAGGIDGFASLVMMVPSEEIGVVVLCNLNGNAWPFLVAYAAIDRLLGLEPIDWLGRAKGLLGYLDEAERQGETQVAAERRSGTSPSRALDAYAGEFEHPAYGRLSVTRNGDSLVAALGSETYPMAHYHYDVFGLWDRHYDLTRRASFIGNARGDIDRVTVPFQPGVGDIEFSRVG